MPIKMILVPMLGGENDGPALEAAGLLAKRSGAHLDAVFVHRDHLSVASPRMSDSLSRGRIESLFKTARKEFDDSRNAARSRFNAWCSAAGFEIKERPDTADTPSAAFSEIIGEPAEIIGKRGRTADVISITRVGDVQKADYSKILEASLLHSGRLVLQVPPQSPTEIGKTVAIAWNGSKEASRAVALALPLLETVERAVVVAGVSDYLTVDEVNGLVDSLAWHGVNVTARTFPIAGGSVSDRLQAEARAVEADTILLGAYSHSRLRELIFGGVTANILDRAEVPVLMAH